MAWYADTAGSNTAPYDTWAKAATSLQTIVDLVTAGGAGYARGSFSEAVDVDTQSGSKAAGYVKIIGCAADGSVDGTRAVITGGGVRASCLQNCDQDMVRFDNFEFTAGTGSGVDLTSGATNGIWNNCISHSNGAHGYNCSGTSHHRFFRCKAYSNTNDGWYDTESTTLQFLCKSYSNGDDGIDAVNSTVILIASAYYDNGENDVNVNQLGENALIYNSIADGTGQTGETGIFSTRDYVSYIANRITNCATGIDASDEAQLFGYNLFHNNTADTANAGLLDPLPEDADADTNEYDPDVDDGYNDASTGDYNLKASRTNVGDGTDVVEL